MRPPSRSKKSNSSLDLGSLISRSNLRRLSRKRTVVEFVVLLFSVVGLIAVAYYRPEWTNNKHPQRFAVAAFVLIVGWALARAANRRTLPKVLANVDPTTAGAVSFVLRVVLLGASIAIALRLCGLGANTIGAASGIIAVVFGFAAQQTLGNVLAGVVLLSARPFRVGDRLRLQAGALAGQTEGVVVSLGLLYATLSRGEDSILVPNNVVVSAAVIPLREPAAIDLRARLRPDVRPRDVQIVLDDAIKTPLRSSPHIHLEEVRSQDVVVRVAATPVYDADGVQLADEILTAMASMTQEGETAEREIVRDRHDEITRNPQDPVTQEYES